MKTTMKGRDKSKLRCDDETTHRGRELLRGQKKTRMRRQSRGEDGSHGRTITTGVSTVQRRTDDDVACTHGTKDVRMMLNNTWSADAGHAQHTG